MKALNYYAVNIATLFIFYLGFVDGHAWAMRVFLFLVWFSIFLGVLLLSKNMRDAVIKSSPDNPAPPMVEHLINLLIACCLAADARYITAGFFVLAIIGFSALFSERANPTTAQ